MPTTRLNWRAYLPADEREYELYSTAYRRSYSFMCGVLLSVIGFYKIATITETLRPSLMYIFLIIYVLAGFLLAEWVGSRVFVGQDVSFSKKREAFHFVEGTWSGLITLLLFMGAGYTIVFILSNWIQ